MIKLEGKILNFEENIGNNTHRFSKDCVISIPESVPLLWEFDRDQVLGNAKVEKKEDGLYCTANIDDSSILTKEQLKAFFPNDIGCGGYYDNVHSHKDEHNILVVDSCHLKNISIVLAPISKHHRLHIKEENND